MSINKEYLKLVLKERNIKTVFDKEKNEYNVEDGLPEDVEVLAEHPNCFGSKQNLKNWIDYVNKRGKEIENGVNIKPKSNGSVDVRSILENASPELLAEMLAKKTGGEKHEVAKPEVKPEANPNPENPLMKTLNEMDEDGLREYAKVNFGEKLHHNSKKETLIEKILELVEAD